MLRWLARVWDFLINKPRRRVDLTILWPQCKKVSLEQGEGMDGARAVFMFHAVRDPAWGIYTEDELYEFIDNLE